MGETSINLQRGTLYFEGVPVGSISEAEITPVEESPDILGQEPRYVTAIRQGFEATLTVQIDPVTYRAAYITAWAVVYHRKWANIGNSHKQRRIRKKYAKRILRAFAEALEAGGPLL